MTTNQNSSNQTSDNLAPDRVGSALVTGATSGLGFEAAVQAAEAGYAPVTITGRTEERVAEARTHLETQTGRKVFEVLVLDLGDRASVAAAVDELAGRGRPIDYALLNAGMVSGSTLTRTEEGVEITFASSLIGHHRLTMGLLHRSLLGPEARIVIAGSEAARNDVPTFTAADLPSLAAKSYAGDLVAAAQALIRHDEGIKFKPANVYATAKLFVAWWASELARRLPAGMTVNAVSPGSAPGTDAARNANFFMKRVMIPMFKLAPKRLGMAATVPVAASRYLEAARFDPKVTGRFFASAPKKMTGPLHEVTLDHVRDRASAQAAWRATMNVAGVDIESSADAQ